MTLAEHIIEAMNNAAENGYANEIEQLTDEQWAADLMDCDADIAPYPFDQVLAAVTEFRSERYRRS